MEHSENIKTTMASHVSSVKKQMQGQEGQQLPEYRLNEHDCREIIDSWPSAPQRVAEDMLKRYGLPNEGTPSQLVWYNNHPWKRTVVMRDEMPHNFPMPHTDFIMQYINYHIPVEKVSDIVRFDGSVIVDRTAGEVAARCDLEAMNILTLNLMNDIVVRKYSVEEAREVYAQQASAFMLKRDAPYTQGLLFDVPQKDTADLDETNIPHAMMNQGKEKIKDAFRE
jgi:hypothetical protein